MRKRTTVGVLAAVLALALGLGTAWASGTAGLLDTSFGAGGVVNGGAATYWGVVALSDGSVLTVTEEGTSPQTSTFWLEKRTPSGALDPSFGGGDGRVDAGLGVPAYGAKAKDLVVAPDGSILLAGYAVIRTEVPGKGKKTKIEEYRSGRVVAFTSTGVLDTGFGASGYFDTNAGVIHTLRAHGTAAAYDLVLSYQRTVSITTGGGGKGKKRQGTTTSSRAVALHRITDSGVNVASFGTGGVVVDDISHLHEDLPHTIEIDSQGRIVVLVAQYLKTDGADPLDDWLVSRYTAVGTLDGTFGTAGRISLGALTQQTDIVIDGTDAVIVAGHNGALDPDVVRYTVNGAYDISFAVPSIPDTTNPLELDTWTNSVLVDSAGRVVVGMWYGTSNWDFTAVRCLSTGALDTSFGTNGIATPFDGYDQDAPHAFTLDGSDRIVAVGKQILSTTPISNPAVIVRWLGM